MCVGSQPSPPPPPPPPAPPPPVAPPPKIEAATTDNTMQKQRNSGRSSLRIDRAGVNTGSSGSGLNIRT